MLNYGPKLNPKRGNRVAVRRRTGILVPVTNTTAEPDFHRAAPAGTTIHSHRLWLANERAGEERIDAMNAELEQGARYLAQGKMDVLAMVGTTNSFYRGIEYGDEMEEIMARMSGVPSVTTSLSVARALKFFGARKISVATPYPTWNNDRLKEYYSALGFQVLNVDGEPWCAASGAREINDLEPMAIAEFAAGVCRPQADALFCPCTGWRAMEAAEELERRLQIPVITAVQATAWRTFRKAGITRPIAGSARLLELMPAIEG